MKALFFMFPKKNLDLHPEQPACGRVEGWLTGIAPHRAALVLACGRAAKPVGHPGAIPRCHGGAISMHRSCKIRSCHGVRVWPIHRARRRRGALRGAAAFGWRRRPLGCLGQFGRSAAIEGLSGCCGVVRLLGPGGLAGCFRSSAGGRVFRTSREASAGAPWGFGAALFGLWAVLALLGQARHAL